MIKKCTQCCNGYKNPAVGYTYSGVTCDGIYRLTVSGSNYDVFCLMSLNSNGYTKIAQKIANNNTAETKVAYSATGNFITNLPKSFFGSGTIIAKGSMANSNTFNNTYQTFTYNSNSTASVAYGSFTAMFNFGFGASELTAANFILNFDSSASSSTMSFINVQYASTANDGIIKAIYPGIGSFATIDSNFTYIFDSTLQSSFMNIYYL